MSVRKMKICLALAVLFAGTFLPSATSQSADPTWHQPAKTTGYRCVFMGHSFFYPIAETFDEVAVAAGFPDHKQLLRKEGATHGTPGWLWANLPKDDEVWKKLASEDVDLLCFPHHHVSGCKLEDYCNWIDYARQRNPGIMVAIALPWGPLCNVEPEQFSDFYRTQFEIPVHRLADDLRKRYPENAIFAISHGKGVVELYAKFKAGKVPEIRQVVQPAGDDEAEGFFTDLSAHIGRMPVVLSQLIWLATIYEVDVRRCRWETGYEFDLKKMAHDIVRKEPYARIPKKPTRNSPGWVLSQSDTEGERVRSPLAAPSGREAVCAAWHPTANHGRGGTNHDRKGRPVLRPPRKEEHCPDTRGGARLSYFGQ